jgi:mannosyltransferase
MSRLTRRRWDAIVLTIFVAALAVRVSTLAGQSLWADEGFTAQIVTGPFSDVISSVRHSESTPPLYYLLEWFWVALAGHSEFALRMPSALLGAATVGPIFAIASRLGTRTAGVAASALVACSPFLIWYSQEARAYALLAFLSTVGLWFFVRAVSDESSWAFLGWATCSALALATHYFAIFAVLSEAVWLVWNCRRKWMASVSAAIAGGVFLALLPLLSYQRDHVPRPWTTAFSLRDEILATGQEFVGGHTWTPIIHHILIPALGLSLLALVGLGAKARPSVVRNPVAVVGAFTVAAPIVLGVLGTNYLAPRNVISAWPAAAIVLGLAAAAVGRIGSWTIGVVCVSFVAIAAGVASDSSLQRDDWRGLLGSIARPTAIAVADGRTDMPVVRYYRPDMAICRGGTELPTVALVGHRVAVSQAAQQSSDRYRPVSSRVVQRLVAQQMSAKSPVRQGCFPASSSVTLLPTRTR